MPWHWQDLNDAKPKRYWSHGRGWSSTGSDGWRFSWAFPRRAEGEASVVAYLCDRSHWTLHASLLGWGMWFGHGDSGYAEKREYGLQFHHGSLWWKYGADPMGWSSKTPRWRDGYWSISELVLGSRSSEVEEVIEEREVIAPMPEGCYPVKARLEIRVLRGRFHTRRWRSVNLDVLDTKGGIPHDGKGENSWDCGADGTYGLYTHECNSIEEGVGQLVATCLRNRARYGNSIAKQGGLMAGEAWAAGVDRPQGSER